MEAVDILLFCVVGFSVVVFLIVDSRKESRKCRVEGDSKNDGSELVRASDDEFEFDDWEGIERTELERSFGEAVVFVNGERSIDEDVKLQLYALEMVALQGSCPKPTPFNASARAKWNAWQKVGNRNMRREMAMQEYLNILENAIPAWKVLETSISSPQ